MEIFKLFGSIFVNTDQAEKSMSRTDEKAGGLASSLGSAFKKIGAAVATYFAVDKIIDFGKACVEAAASVKAANAQFEQTFGELQSQASGAMERVAESSGILQTRLQGVGTSIYAFAKTTGMESAEALSMMEEALIVTADSAAYYDRSLEDTAESLKSFLKGNYANDAALGLSCTETTRNAAANKLYGKSFKELSESQKQLTLLQMVKDANELSGAMGQAARESDGWENVIGNLKESWKQFQAVIGMPILEAVVPIVQTITGGLTTLTDKLKGGEISASSFGNKLLSMFSPEFKESMMWYINTAFPNMFEHLKNSAVENFKGKLSGLSEVFIKLKDIVQPFVELYIAQLIDTILIAIDLISSVVIPTLGFLFDAFTQIAGTILDSVQPALSSIIDSFSSLYMIIYEAISDYIIPTLEMFIDMIKQLWEENQDKINLIGELFKTVFDLIAEKVEWFVGVVQEYIYPLFIWFVETVQNNMDIIKNIFQSVFDMIGGIIQFFIALFKGDWSGMWEAIKIILDGAFSFIKNIFELISAFIGSIGDAIKEKVKKAFENIKTSMVSQISEAKDSVVKTFTAIKNAIEEKIDAAKKIVSAGIEKIKSFFNFEWSLPKLKLPHFNISGEFSLKPPSVPSFGVEWYKDGGIMTQPTAFGFNPLTNKAMVGGEVEPEAIAPISVLQEYVRNAVAGENQDIVAVLNLILQGIYALGERLGILENLQLVLDSGALVGEIANKMDSELGTIVSWKERNG